MKSPPYPLPLEERLIGVSVAMTKEKKREAHLLVSFVPLLLQTSICRNPTVVCRVTRNAEYCMQAKATERSRFLMRGRKEFPGRIPTPFLYVHVYRRCHALPDLPYPAGPQQSTCAVHFTRCRRLRVVTFLDLTLPPSPAAAGRWRCIFITFISHRKS